MRMVMGFDAEKREVFLVVFDDKAKSLGERIFPDLEEYIDQNYVEDKHGEEYGNTHHIVNRKKHSQYTECG